jgi:hypothetical protein
MPDYQRFKKNNTLSIRSPVPATQKNPNLLIINKLGFFVYLFLPFGYAFGYAADIVRSLISI